MGDGDGRARGDRVEALQAAIMAFAKAVDGLVELEHAWEDVPRGDRDGVYRELERARSRLCIADAGYLASRGINGIVRETDRTVGDLAHGAHLSRAEARRRIRSARRIQDEDAVPGHFGRARDRLMPEVRERIAAGVAGADAVEIIDRELDKLPASADELVRKADPHIAALLGQVEVDDLRALGSMLRAMLQLDDPYTDEDRARRRGLHMSGPDPDNMRRLSGWVTPEFAAMIQRLWADHARPGSLLPEGTPPAADFRSASQRRHDALLAAVGAGYRPAWADGEPGSPDARDDGSSPVNPGGDAGGDAGGGAGGAFAAVGPDFAPRPPVAPRRPGRGAGRIGAVVGVAALAARAGVAVTDVGTTISVPEALRMASPANVFLSVLDARGCTMWFGRARRTASLAQYLALCAEEGCSTAPGTGSPPASCDVHHVHAWSNGGGTDIRNLTLVDRRLHGMIDDDAADPRRWWTRPGPDAGAKAPGAPPGASPCDPPPPSSSPPPTPAMPSGVSAGPGSPGKVHWIPPSDVDPRRRPRVNAHPLAWMARGAQERREHRMWARRQAIIEELRAAREKDESRGADR